MFTSSLWKALFKMEGVSLLLSTAYHPQTDGQTERVNQCLEMYLRCAISDSPRQWKNWLSQAEFWYNSSFHSSLGCSPFKALYGYDPAVGAVHGSTAPPPSSVADLVLDRQVQATRLKEHLAQSQLKMKQIADRKRSEVEFQVGDSVLLKLHPYVQSSMVSRPFPKLAKKYFGPYKVIARVGKTAYTLELPADSLIHPTFHVSQLKAFVPDFSPTYSTLLPTVDLAAEVLIPETVLDRRLVKKGNKAVPQVLVKWRSVPATSATWEDFYVVSKKFPDALAWGQASFGEGEVVVP